MVGSRMIARMALLSLLFLFALAALAATGGRTVAALTGEEAAAKIAADYGVKVLRLRSGTIDGTMVWLVTVMKPGRDSNDAFQVTTLAVDQATGRLVTAFRRGPSGPAWPAARAFDMQIDKRPGVFRSGGPWR